jgi:hypothetical protein
MTFHHLFENGDISLKDTKYCAADPQTHSSHLISSHVISSLASFAADGTECLKNDCQRKSSKYRSSHSICCFGSSKCVTSGTFSLNSSSFELFSTLYEARSADQYIVIVTTIIIIIIIIIVVIVIRRHE